MSPFTRSPHPFAKFFAKNPHLVPLRTSLREHVITGLAAVGLTLVALVAMVS